MLLVNLGLIIALAVIVLLIIIFVSFIVKTYNKMVRGRNKCKDAFAQIDVQLTRRFDLIPNLVETVKGYAKHEEGILSEFAKARGAYQAASSAGDVEGLSNANNALTSVLTRFMAVSEQYPELKANVNFSRLMDELTNTESKVAYSRQFYNDVAQKYNIEVEMFPGNIIANLFNFDAVEYFEVESEEVNKAPKVEF